MRNHETEFPAQTTKPFEVVDVTGDVEKAVRASGIADGRVTVFSPGGGCRLVLNEWESGLLFDIKRALERMMDRAAPPQALFGSSALMFPLVSHELSLGTWQRVLLVEFDPAGDRRVIVQVMGE